jgi:hypothetical protein
MLYRTLHRVHLHSTVLCIILQYFTIHRAPQYSQYSTVLYSALFYILKYSTVLYITLQFFQQYSTIHSSPQSSQYCTILFKHSTALYSTLEHSRVHSAELYLLHRTKQYSTYGALQFTVLHTVLHSNLQTI